MPASSTEALRKAQDWQDLLDTNVSSLGRSLADEGRQADAAEERARKLEEALRGVLPLLESVEDEMLVGDEGCLWPVEVVRALLDSATHPDHGADGARNLRNLEGK